MKSAISFVCLFVFSHVCLVTQCSEAAGPLPVIPQPAEWKPAGGECDLSKAAVDARIDASAGLGEEGYEMSISPDAVRIVAGGETGGVWARRTLAQLKSRGPKAPCGVVRDEPKYRVRGFMMDVGRMFHSMDFLYDLARTMSWYKMNTLHVHLNDNEIPKFKNNRWNELYSAFRMECQTYPELTAKDGHYTKKEFREFMLFAKSIGVMVVPEFDVPAHSLAFTRVRPDFASKKYGEDHFDLDKSVEIVEWLKPLFAEYLAGPEPVFIGPYMHVGTDEYDKREAEKFRAFTDSMLRMVAGFGYKPCAWGALTHARGETPVLAGRDITIDIWHNPYYKPEEALKAGYSIVAVPDAIAYIVPFANYYRDYLDCRRLYETWEPRNIGGYTVPDEYLPQLAGGKFALWNDLLGKKRKGGGKYGKGDHYDITGEYTEADNWDRIHPALQTLSQKFWLGGGGAMPWAEFAALADSMSEPEGVRFKRASRLSERR